MRQHKIKRLSDHLSLVVAPAGLERQRWSARIPCESGRQSRGDLLMRATGSVVRADRCRCSLRPRRVENLDAGEAGVGEHATCGLGSPHTVPSPAPPSASEIVMLCIVLMP
jgi:hypothetical protein